MREEVATKALKLRTWAEGLKRYQFNNSTVIPYRKPLWSRFFSALSHLRSLKLNYKTKRAPVNVLMNYFFSRISLLSYKVLINSRKEWPFSCTLKEPHFYVLFWARERDGRLLARAFPLKSGCHWEKTGQNVKMSTEGGQQNKFIPNIIDRLGGVMDKYNKHRFFTALVVDTSTSITLFDPLGRHFYKQI